MKRSTDRILTTHCGSLARPNDLLEMTRAKLAGEPYDPEAFAGRIRGAVKEYVAKQVECGIDIVNDGEQSKDSFYAYARERLTGLDAAAPEPGSSRSGSREIMAFPEFYRDYYFIPRSKGRVGPDLAITCTGPVSYAGQAAVQTDIANLRDALDGLRYEDAFIPATAPRAVGSNRFYKTDEEYFEAAGEAMHEEYQAIADAGFLLQIDDPWLTQIYDGPDADRAAQRRRAEIYVEALNHALRGIPPERVRFHTCYGINEGPRVHDLPLSELIDLMLTINAQAYSFEAANARHEHEWRVFEEVKLPEGKVLIPGVITHTSNIVEHPEVIADRIERFARLVGRENVIAGADCGFSSQASFTPDVHPTVVWAKFQALSEGAELATKRLW
ncbi:MAG: cobalamin-independent methionine synthase II family protein [Dehalococcoidia bacterium]